LKNLWLFNIIKGNRAHIERRLEQGMIALIRTV